jgi:hypothetical protein
MKREGRVVKVTADLVLVVVAGNGGSNQPVAPCCQIPDETWEVKNPAGVELDAGDQVEVTDGLGIVMLGASLFLIFPGVFYAVLTTLVPGWVMGLIAGLFGLVVAVLVFRALNVRQFPRVVRRIGIREKELV